MGIFHTNRPVSYPQHYADNVPWLVRVAVGDANFRARLARATWSEVMEALRQIPADVAGNKGRVRALRRRLAELEREKEG